MMPFQFKTYFKVLFQSLYILPSPWSLRRVITWCAIAFLFPIGQFLTFLGLVLDHIFFSGFKKISVEKPVFIIGNARSGTTYMHRLMACDTEYFNAFKLSDLILISVTWKKLFSFLGKIDKRFGYPLKKRLESFQEKKMKGADKIHKLRLDQPEEDEAVLVHIFASAFIAVLFPVPNADDSTFFDELPEKKRHKIMNFYKSVVQRQLYFNGKPNVHLLSKNPLFCMKVKTLSEIFPDSKIVYMARSPYDTFASVHNMIDKIWGFHLDLPKDFIGRQVLTQVSIKSYNYVLSELDKKPKDSYSVVKYDDLIDKPFEVVEEIYSKFQIPMSETYRKNLLQITENTKKYKSEHTYNLEKFGLTKDYVYSETKDVFDRYGFDPQI